jgi:ABC-2 type transport system ATP-binding protein
LQKALNEAGFKHEKEGKGLAVQGAKTDQVGKLAHEAKVTVLELTQHSASLERAFLELTEGAAEYEANTPEVKK